MSQHEYSQHERPQLSNLGWHGLLHEALTTDDVLVVVRDYLALWTPEEIAGLSPELRPHKLVDAEDVNVYALDLVRAQHVETHPTIELHKMATFFSAASLRLSQILSTASQVSSEGGE